MSYFFDISGNVCIPKEEILLVEPFKGIYARGGIKDLSFIELYSSKLRSNPYAGFSDEERCRRLGEDIYGKKGLRYEDLSEDVRRGIERLVEYQTEGSPTYSYYVSQLRAVEKLRNFFLEFDLGERNERGQLIYKPKEITSALSDAEKIIQNLGVLRDKVETEMYESIKTRANREIGAYEE